MLLGHIRSSIPTAVSSAVLSKGSRSNPPVTTFTHVFRLSSRSISSQSIANAMTMLQRAVKAHKAEMPLSQSTLSKMMQQPGKSNSQESYGSPASALFGGSQNDLKNAMTRSTVPSAGGKASIQRTPSGGYKRTSDYTTGGLAAALNKTDSFSDPSVIDLTDDSAITSGPDSVTRRTSKMPVSTNTASTLPLDFNIDDFEDDDELDIDVVYPTPINATTTSHRSPPPLSESTGNAVKTFETIKSQTTATNPSSSIPWSSSPPSHFATPPGALARRQTEQARSSISKSVEIIDLENDDVEVVQPAAKRSRSDEKPPSFSRSSGRTLPWGNEPEVTIEEPVKATNMAKNCFECNKPGHFAKECPVKHGKSTSFTMMTPSKEKTLPWNTTASTLKERQKELKAKSRAPEKAPETTTEKMLKAVVDTQDMLANVEDSRALHMSAIQLSEEQEKILDMVVNQSKSVFFTGSAGTGKSVLMREIIKALRKKFWRDPDRLSVTASTGLAACNIGGMTLHSFAGIGLGYEDVNILERKVRKNPKAKTRWLRTKVLIIDEISMVDGALFDKLEALARHIRNNGRSFGGIQLVITGDFFQLPPVPDRNGVSKFSFDAESWSKTIHHTIGLTQVFRQKDPEFARLLNDMRVGKISDESVRLFQSLSRPLKFDDSLEATELFPTRYEVENANALKMRNLKGHVYTYEAEDTGRADKETIQRLLSNMMAPAKLSLKKGAQVMLIKNMDDTLVNGSLGHVRAFMDPRTFAIYDSDPDLIDSTLPEEELDENVRKAREKLKALISKDMDSNRSQVYPLVRFSNADGTYRELLIQPEEWKVELPNGEVQAQRRQLPLILAWALSIHKAQGQTIERVKVNLGKAFEHGQAYVALSRATSKEGLQVLNFKKEKVMAHPKVATFYNSLYSVDKIGRKSK